VEETIPAKLTVSSPYYTTTEAAQYLRTTIQGIYSLVKRGRLHPMSGRPGRLLFTRESLDRYLSTRRR
jgi:excisionase family DNA binding protein